MKCVGVWDTDGVLGLVRFFCGNPKFFGFKDSKLSPNITYAFHAIAIDETRIDFESTKWQKHQSSARMRAQHEQVLKQVWFSGSHNDLGGANQNHDLSDTSLVRMVVRPKLPLHLHIYKTVIQI